MDASRRRLTLHYTPGSMFARIIRVLIRELQIECREVEITTFPPAPEYFSINPLGQVPALETEDGIRFPTRIIIDYVMELDRTAPSDIAASVRRSGDFWQDDQTLAVLLAMGDALGAIKYQSWAGLVPGSENLIGYDPADRHMERVQRTLDWLESRATGAGFLPDCVSVQDIVLACFILWSEARGTIPWRGRSSLESIVATCSERPSFLATKPQPWP